MMQGTVNAKLEAVAAAESARHGVAADNRPHHIQIAAPQGAAADKAREDFIEEFRRANAEVLQDPEVAAEFEKSLRERFPDR
jgi:hypothetical protein